MPKKKLTDAFVRNIAPPKRSDTPNQKAYIDTIERGLALMLVVSYGGTKSFRAMTYSGGRPKTTKLGTYPKISLAEAKKAARELWQNPRAFYEKAQSGAFGEVAEEWFTRHVIGGGLRSAKAIRRALNLHILPAFRDMKFIDVRRTDVSYLLDKIHDEHGARSADLVRAYLSHMMRWYESRTEGYTSPIVSGMKRDKRSIKDKARSRTLSDDEIRSLWAATEKLGSAGDIVKLLLLTAQRRDKLATMCWQDIQGGVWSIPTRKREKSTAEKIALPSSAIEIINRQSRRAHSKYVFPSRTGGPFNHWSQLKEQLDNSMGEIAPWVFHDLRRTARVLMSRAGVSADIGELALGHSLMGVRAVYDKRSAYQKQLDEAFKVLGMLIDGIVNPPSNVVRLERK